MIILSLRTDKPDAEIGLFNGTEQIAYEQWSAHRQLAETIHMKIDQVLNDNNLKRVDIQGIAVYQGPGSFTGLRIGLTVANALAGALNVPIVGTQHEAWLTGSLNRLVAGENDRIVVPEYGALPNITAPKK